MKKTLIALMAMASSAMAQAEWIVVDTFEPEDGYTLKQGGDGIDLDFSDTLSNGAFICNKIDGSNTSPAVGKAEMDFVLTNTEVTATLINFSTSSTDRGSWGVVLKDGNLYLGQMVTNDSNTTSAMYSWNQNCFTLGEVSEGTAYTLTIISSASTTGANGKSVIAGRGVDNFQVELSTGGAVVWSTYCAGFGLNSNGEGLQYVTIGGSNSLSETAVFGSVSKLVLSVPEPTTATLSLLALCGLAARRRRK